MPLHPQLVPLAEGMAGPDAVKMSDMTPDEARASYLALSALFGPGEAVGSVEDRVVPGPAGEIPVRVYTPAELSGPAPVVVFYHGGGWVIGDLESHDRECRAICNRARAIVVSVHYRRAPEAPFPAAFEDSVAALDWVGAHAGELGGDPTRIAVAGDSAGGNLSAAVALHARDHGGPKLCFQLLVYPAVDAAGDEQTYPSLVENEAGPFLTTETMTWFQSHYVAGGDVEALSKLPGETLRDPRMSPLHAASHEGLPPTHVVTAELDPLRDQGRAYAEVLESAGVPVTLHEYDGMAHIFFQLSPICDDAKALIDECGALLSKAFSQS
jgi:acetyl esterase